MGDTEIALIALQTFADKMRERLGASTVGECFDRIAELEREVGRARGSGVRDWIVAKQGDLSFECRRCGARDAVELPASVTVWVAAARAFEKLHRSCKPKPDQRAG